jgi:hypothetical protein
MTRWDGPVPCDNEERASAQGKPPQCERQLDLELSEAGHEPTPGQGEEHKPGNLRANLRGRDGEGERGHLVLLRFGGQRLKADTTSVTGRPNVVLTRVGRSIFSQRESPGGSVERMM